MVFTVEDNIAYTDNTKGLTLSQEEKWQIHSSTLRELQHTFDFGLQHYQVRSATEVHVGLFQVSVIW